MSEPESQRSGTVGDAAWTQPDVAAHARVAADRDPPAEAAALSGALAGLGSKRRAWRCRAGRGRCGQTRFLRERTETGGSTARPLTRNHQRPIIRADRRLRHNASRPCVSERSLAAL